MSDLGEKTCPLCAEEMDLTDQHLKPCKCGYEICVWCWHHIMDMAEKNDSDGRCPACRAPYNKEKIVGTASNCERLVAEMNTEKKLKSNKGKSKTSEVRKHLTSVRVIQKNLVYLVGLPLNLADEDLLQRKEYFGQYGKVLKVSISRTTTGAIQHFANNTCSVYITYSKEEEAICCIQSVHEFILEGRQLKACFGTTKYCHAWLRNMPCINSDCLYLHEFGLEEDRFSKDEAVSAFSRNRTQQGTSVTNSTQRRSGNVLPPPADEYFNNSCTSPEKPTSKNVIMNTSCSTKISPPNSSSGRSVALPAGASWGSRSSNNQPTPGNLLMASNGLHKQKVDTSKGQKVDTSKGPVTFSAAVASSNHVILPHNDAQKKLREDDINISNHKETKLEIKKEHAVVDSEPHSASDSNVSPGRSTSISIKVDLSSASKNNKDSSLPSDITSSESSETKPVDDRKSELDDKIKDTRSNTSSVCLARNQGPTDGVDQCKEATDSLPAEVPTTYEIDITTTKNKSYIRPDSATSLVDSALSEDVNDILSFDDQRFDDPIGVTTNGIYSADLLHTPLSSKSRGHSEQHNGLSIVNKDSQFVDTRVHPISYSSDAPVLFSGYRENESSVSSPTKNTEDNPYLPSVDDRTLNMRRFGSRATGIDMGENTIISDILSLDLDSLDEPLSSQNFAKLFGENDIKHGSHKLPSPWKSQHGNQSRFSFAREEEQSMNAAPRFASHVNYIDHAQTPRSFVHDRYESTNLKVDKFSSQNGFSLVNGEEHDHYNGFDSRFGFDNPAVSRSQTAAPPGFSTPKRAPPPGFTSYEKMERPSANPLYGNYAMDASFLPSHQYQIPQAGNVACNGDVEFIDPAILAVGKGRISDGFNGVGLELRSRFSPHFNNYETNARPQLLMQRSHLQNQGYDIGDRYLSGNDSFRIPSRVVEQSIGHNMSQYSGVGGLMQSRSGHWDTWRDIQNGNNMAMADLLRGERLGFNKFHTGYEDSALPMPSQGDLYNRTYGF